MAPIVNNENEYRLARSSNKVLDTRDEERTEDPGAGTHGTAHAANIQVSTREYLGDLSNQNQINDKRLRPTAGRSRPPLGGDNQPLQQIASRMPQKRQATESSTNLVEKLHPQIKSEEPSELNGGSRGGRVIAQYKKSKLSTNPNHYHEQSSHIQNNSDNAHEIETEEKENHKQEHDDNIHVSETPQLHLQSSYEWEDLDEEDADDPLMVSEYVNDIFPYLRELEYKTLPDSQYLFKQKHLKPKMRSILVDWLVEMHLRFRLLPETLFLAINIMDRFMSLEVVQIDKLQLLATGSLFIAAKYEEVFSPSVKNYAYFTDGSYTEEEILQAEKYVLTVLNFDLSYPNPMNFLRRILKADDYDVRSRTLGKYLLEISIIDYKFIGIMPSLCSALAMYISRLILQKLPVWNGNLIHYSGEYTVEDMKECIEKMVTFLVSPIEHEEFHKKYASRKFMKASLVCRSWAKKVIAEGRDIFNEDFPVKTSEGSLKPE